MFLVLLRSLTVCRGDLSAVIVQLTSSIREKGRRGREVLELVSRFLCFPLNIREYHMKENLDRKIEW